MIIEQNKAVITHFPLDRICSTCKSSLSVELSDIFFTADTIGHTAEGKKAFMCPCCGYRNEVFVITSITKGTIPLGNTKITDQGATLAPAQP